MKIGPLGTVCYRLLVEPELGTGLGNTVFVGLELRDADDHAELMFSGLERRIETIRGELDRVRTYTGHLFSIDGPTNARDLASAMASMRRYAPELVLGKELVERSRESANAAWDAARAAIEQFNAGVAIDARCVFCNEQPLVVDRVPAETPTQWLSVVRARKVARRSKASRSSRPVDDISYRTGSPSSPRCASKTAHPRSSANGVTDRSRGAR